MGIQKGLRNWMNKLLKVKIWNFETIFRREYYRNFFSTRTNSAYFALAYIFRTPGFLSDDIWKIYILILHTGLNVLRFSLKSFTLWPWWSIHQENPDSLIYVVAKHRELPWCSRYCSPGVCRYWYISSVSGYFRQHNFLLKG